MLTKSDFLLFLESPLHLWAKQNGKITKENDQFIKSLIKQGYDVEEKAKEFVRKQISNDFEFQKEFNTQVLSCRTDFVVKNTLTSKYDIYEVKSGTDIKLDHEYDVTFQYIVASQVEEIGKVYIIHLNKEYVYENSLDISQLFVIVDMTKVIEKRRLQTEILVKEALLLQHKDTPNGLAICYKPKDCCCPQLCFPSLPQYSIFNLSNVHKERLIELKEMGISDLKDIPDEYPLSKRQAIQVKSTKLQKTIYEKDRIEDFLSNLVYPLYFLDYESYAWPIPHFNNHKVFENVVFQYSLHIQEYKGSTLEHVEFISDTKEDPMHDVAQNITKAIGDLGSVIVWNKQFEKGCNKEMGRIYSEFKEKLSQINSRVFDLSDIFSKQMYVDYKFKGSWSIKNILPILAPELNYNNLDIHNGTMAMIEWEQMVYGNLDTFMKEKIKKNLLEYCKLDTYAMYMILQSITEIIKN